MKNDIITNIPNYEGIGVYSLTNNVTGKKYIGSSINVKARIMQHLYSFRTLKCSQKFVSDLKNGHTFSAEVLEKFPYGTSEYLLREKESDYIAQERLWEHGYNYAPASYIDAKLKNRHIVNKPKKQYQTLSCKVQKEKYEEIKAAADAAGEPVNGYIKKAIDERM